MARPASPTGRASLGDPENADQKQKRAEYLPEEGGSCIVLTKIPGSPAVLAQRSTPARSLARKDDIEDDGPSNGAENLRNHISHEILCGHAPSNQHAETDRWINVASRNLADAIGHGDNGKSEGCGDAENVDRSRASSHATDDRGTAAD